MGYIITALLGVSIGSFANVLVMRWGTRRSSLRGRSECVYCRATLRWYELIPIVSFLFLRGKCRTCKGAISWQYLAGEVLAGVIFVVFFRIFGIPSTVQETLFAVLVVGFFMLAYFDIAHFILPDALIFPLMALTILATALDDPSRMQEVILTGIVLGSFFGILYVVSRGRWVGLGDVKLLVLIGFVFGYPLGYLILVCSVWFGALTGITLVLMRHARMQSALPFGAFLSTVSIVGILFFHELQFFSRFF